MPDIKTKDATNNKTGLMTIGENVGIFFKFEQNEQKQTKKPCFSYPHLTSNPLPLLLLFIIIINHYNKTQTKIWKQNIA